MTLNDPSPQKIFIAAFYRFAALEDHRAMRQPLLELMQTHGVKGTVLLAPEGINGTVAGSRDAIDATLAWLKSDPRLAELTHKESYADAMPFYRTKVKLKKEIVTMGVPSIDPQHLSGTYVDPGDWNALLDDPDVIVIDTRNEYEVQIGAFEQAVNPHTESFRDFPKYVDEHLDPTGDKKIAMYCTGGIRCEKSTAYLKQKGFKDVYHLRGGILKYLEEVPEPESRWHGECFVFDERVTVDHQLNQGHYGQCNACRMPITDADKQSEHYVPGISCPHCHDKTTAQQRDRFAERQTQVNLSHQRGESHLGGEVALNNQKRREQKRQIKNQQREGGKTERTRD